jgi:hypothetical protein
MAYAPRWREERPAWAMGNVARGEYDDRLHWLLLTGDIGAGEEK